MNKPVLFIYRKMKEDNKVSRAKNPKYESMSLEELKANMEKSRQELEAAIHNKNILEQEDVQNVMNQLQKSSYNKSIVRQTYISASQKDRRQIAEAVKKTENGDDS